MPNPPVPGPYDEAINAIGAQINALTLEIKTLRDGHAPKADLDAVRAELADARSELTALKKVAAPKPPKKDDAAPEPVPLPDEDSCASGFW